MVRAVASSRRRGAKLLYQYEERELRMASAIPRALRQGPGEIWQRTSEGRGLLHPARGRRSEIIWCQADGALRLCGRFIRPRLGDGTSDHGGSPGLLSRGAKG